MKNYLILFLLMAAPLLGQETGEVDKGNSLIFSWDEVVEDTLGNPLTRNELYYRIYAAPFINGVAIWSQQDTLLSMNWQPSFWDIDNKINTDIPITLAVGEYQIVVTAYRYDSLWRQHESNNLFRFACGLTHWGCSVCSARRT